MSIVLPDPIGCKRMIVRESDMLARPSPSSLTLERVGRVALNSGGEDGRGFQDGVLGLSKGRRGWVKPALRAFLLIRGSLGRNHHAHDQKCDHRSLH